MDTLDKECVRRCSDGHPEEFEILVDRYQRPVFSFLAVKPGNPMQAGEAVQESFVRAFVSLRKLKKPESFYTWLLGIADRVAKEQFRRRKRRHRESDIETTRIDYDQSVDSNVFHPVLPEHVVWVPDQLSALQSNEFYAGLTAERAAGTSTAGCNLGRNQNSRDFHKEAPERAPFLCGIDAPDSH